MNRKYTSCAFCFFALSLTPLLASPTTENCQEPPKPMGVTTQPCGVITPPQAPTVPRWANFFFTADFIYWRTTVDNYTFAASGTPIVVNGALGSPTTRGKSPLPGFDFQPGFKVGAGFKFAHDGWDLYANYTWLNPAKVKASISNSGGYMVGPGDPYWGTPTLSKVENTFKQSFNILDLELGRQFFLSSFLTLRPYFGLKAAWIDQHQRNNLTVYNDLFNGLITGISSVIGPPNNTITNLIQRENVKSWGIGVRGGFYPVWYFIKNFGLYGNFAASCMWTSFRTNTDTSFVGFFTDPVTGAVTPINGITGILGRSSHTVTPVIEVGLGLTSTIYFCENSRALTISAGWEKQVWIGFNGGYPGGNLSVQGLTFKAGFEF